MKTPVVLALLATLVFAAACDRSSRDAADGRIRVSAAYVEAFGQPPVPNQGECLARVGYFPLRSDPGRVRPVPFFLLGERDPLAQLLNRLAGGEVPLTFDADLFNPFPAGSRLLVGERRDDRVVIELQFSGPMPAADVLQPIAAVVTETAGQFDGIATVIIHHDGQPLPGMPADGYAHDPARIVSPGPPVLFMIAGAWKRDGSGPEEIVANFDRPVTIHAFRLANAAGEELPGDTFQSGFNMSVVLHPADAGTFVENMPLTASWEVSDALGRKGGGTQTFSLLRREHADLH